MATNNAWNSNIPVEIAKGGTNTTSFATTDGTVYYDGTQLTTTATGTSGQILTSGGAGVAPTYQNGGMYLIQTQNAAASASIAFTTGFGSTPAAYLFVLSGIQPVVNGDQLRMTWSTDGGATYLATNYTAGVNVNGAASTAVSNTSNATYCPLVDTINNAFYYCGYLWIYDLNSSIKSTYVGQAAKSATTFCQTFGANSATGINGIKFFMSTGNINVGQFSLYGFRQ